MKRTLCLLLLLAPAAGAQSYSGTLAPGDDQLDDGEYYDVYAVSAQAGQTLEADLTSDAFDTFLILVAPSGADEQNDDHEGDQRRSYLRTQAAESGEYRVVATSYAGGETGAYRLSVSVGGAASAGPSAPPSGAAGGLVGEWVHGSPSAIQYVDRYTGASAPTSGLGTFLHLEPDGTYREGGILRITTYSCTSQLFVDTHGTYRVSGSTLVLRQSGGRSWGSVCGGETHTRTLEAETITYTVELGQGPAGPTLTRYRDGAHYDGLSRPR